jgi:DNA polymerase
VDDDADKSHADLVERLKFFREIGAEMIFTSELRPRPKPPAALAGPAGDPPLDATGDYDALQGEILVCRKCPLAAGRTRAVPGEGNLAAELMFVGEGPGHDEDVQGRPFVGRAGQMLTKIIAAMTFDRAEVFITNVVKCRPPDNRVPHKDEIAYLVSQIRAIRPRLIVALGKPATDFFVPNSFGSMTQLRGTFYDWNGIPVMPTFHPSYLIRNEGNRAIKQMVWDDMQKVMARLGRSKK